MTIVYEDDGFLVIDKPAGIVVNRADTTRRVETLQDWAEEKIKDQILKIKNTKQISNIEEEFISRSGIVHRLDKDTSGLLVIAKTPEAFEKLKSQFKDRTVVKKYLALVHGIVEPPTGTINTPIERSPFNRMHFGVFPGGREAVTQYKLIKLIKQERYLSLLEVAPHTGRTHQIRVHMKYLGHPVVSDPIYGGRKNYQADLSFCTRLFLHAFYLKIQHPVTGKKVEFKSELPRELQDCLDSLM